MNVPRFKRGLNSDRVVNACLIAGGTFSLGAAVFLVFSTLSDPGSYAGFYAAYGLLSLLFGISLKLPRSFREKVALSAGSTLGFVFLLECILPVPKEGAIGRTIVERAAQQGVQFDTRSKYELIEQLREQDTHACPVVFPYIVWTLGSGNLWKTGLFPLGGISGVETLFCNENGAYAMFDADEHGFRNPPGMHGAEQVQVALLGDSFALGACVDSDEDLAGNLRRSGYRVLNLGMMGNGPLLELATLKEYAQPVHPREVLWIYFEGNDLEELSREEGVPLLRRYLGGDFSQGLRGRQAEIDRALNSFLEAEFTLEKQRQRTQAWLNGGLARTLMLANLRRFPQFFRKGELERYFGPSDFIPGQAALDRFEQTLRAASDLIRSWGGRLHFVYLPSLQRYLNTVDQNRYLGRDHVLDIVRKLDLPIVDVQELFLQQPDPSALYPFRICPHYTPEAYGLIAGKICAHLKGETSAPSGTAPDPRNKPPEDDRD